MTTPLVVLDDDVCAAKFVRGVPLVLADGDLEGVDPSTGMVRWVTGSREVDSAIARTRAHDRAGRTLDWNRTAKIAVHAEPGLRGHLWEEFEGVKEAAFPSGNAALLLMPAVPADGHQVKAGVQFLTDDFDFLPASTSPFSQDPTFGYDSARLVDYAEQRTAGRLKAASAVVVTLKELLAVGPDVVTQALFQACESGNSSLVVVDAASDDHVRLVSDGLAQAWRDGACVIPRASSTLTAMLADIYDSRTIGLPTGRVLVLVEGDASQGAEQRRQLAERYPRVEITNLDASADLSSYDVVVAHGPRAGAMAIGEFSPDRTASILGHLHGGALAVSPGLGAPTVACVPFDIDGGAALCRAVATAAGSEVRTQ